MMKATNKIHGAGLRRLSFLIAEMSDDENAEGRAQDLSREIGIHVDTRSRQSHAPPFLSRIRFVREILTLLLLSFEKQTFVLR